VRRNVVELVSVPAARAGVWRSVPINGDIETKKSRRTLALDPVDWTPRELRHSFVSVLSDAGLPGEEISHLVGHRGATITGLVYRHQLRPVVQTGAAIMDRLFSRRDKDA
jgi:integrase